MPRVQQFMLSFPPPSPSSIALAALLCTALLAAPAPSALVRPPLSSQRPYAPSLAATPRRWASTLRLKGGQADEAQPHLPASGEELRDDDDHNADADRDAASRLLEERHGEYEDDLSDLSSSRGVGRLR